jgi:ribosomal protein S18 acetylase RimI-like enzyme
MHLAVAREHRRKGIGTRILTALQRELSTSESLKVNNIDEEMTSMMGFFEANGFKMMLEQYEMVKSINRGF